MAGFESTDDPQFTVTGKPMDHYEPYVELVSELIANGLTLAADREFLRGLDTSEGSVSSAVAKSSIARDSIRWRFAHLIDEIEAKREAERAVVAE